MESWSRTRKLGTVVLGVAASYLIGWFWIVFLGNPVGIIDESHARNIVIIAMLGAVLGVTGAAGLAIAVLALGFGLGLVVFVVMAPYRLVRYVHQAAFKCS